LNPPDLNAANTPPERGPLGSGRDVATGSFAYRGEASTGGRHRRRAEQTQCPIAGMAGSVLTSTTLRKAPYRTVRRLKL